MAFGLALGCHDLADLPWDALGCQYSQGLAPVRPVWRPFWLRTPGLRNGSALRANELSEMCYHKANFPPAA